MIDEIIATDPTQTTCSFSILDNSIFVDEQGWFLEAGLVENMAQTVAAGTGFQAEKRQEAPPIGFIGQVKNLEIIQLPKVGDVIVTTITQQAQILNAIIVLAEVHLNKTLIAKAEYKIFLQD